MERISPRDARLVDQQRVVRVVDEVVTRSKEPAPRELNVRESCAWPTRWLVVHHLLLYRAGVVRVGHDRAVFVYVTDVEADPVEVSPLILDARQNPVANAPAPAKTSEKKMRRRTQEPQEQTSDEAWHAL